MYPFLAPICCCSVYGITIHPSLRRLVPFAALDSTYVARIMTPCNSVCLSYISTTELSESSSLLHRTVVDPPARAKKVSVVPGKILHLFQVDVVPLPSIPTSPGMNKQKKIGYVIYSLWS